MDEPYCKSWNEYHENLHGKLKIGDICIINGMENSVVSIDRQSGFCETENEYGGFAIPIFSAVRERVENRQGDGK